LRKISTIATETTHIKQTYEKTETDAVTLREEVSTCDKDSDNDNDM